MCFNSIFFLRYELYFFNHKSPDSVSPYSGLNSSSTVHNDRLNLGSGMSWTFLSRSCDFIYAWFLLWFQTLSLYITDIVISIFIFLSLNVLEICIINSFSLFLCPLTIERALYFSFSLPGCLIESANLPPSMFELCSNLFQSKYLSEPLSNGPLISFYCLVSYLCSGPGI